MRIRTLLTVTVAAVWALAGVPAIGAAPEIAGINPAQNGLNIPNTASISVTFGADIDPASINAATFLVRSELRGFLLGDLTYDPGTRTAAFTPADEFHTADLVTVQLTTGIQSPDGTAMAQSFYWSFTVAVPDATMAYARRNEYPAEWAPYKPIAADLNGDGLPDLACSNAHWSADVEEFSMSVYMNNGDGTFGPQTILHPVHHPRDLIAADFDHDGDLDLATTNAHNGTVAIMINNGDGTFADGVPCDVGNQPLALRAADYDGDGDLDLAIIGHPYGRLVVLGNAGDGTLTPIGEYNGTPGGFSMITADMNNDGFPDLVSAHVDLEHGRVVVLLNLGDGSFGPYINYETGDFDFMYGDVLTAADFDADGDIDIAYVSSEDNYVGVLLNAGDGTLQPLDVIPVDTYPSMIYAVDINADRNMDLVISYAVGMRQFTILEGNGDGTFTIVTSSHLELPQQYAMSIADLNGNGRLDLAAPNMGGDKIQVWLMRDYTCGDANWDGGIDIGDAVYVVRYVFHDGEEPYPLAAGDTNSDGAVNVGDAVFLINYIFRNGPAPGQS